ncbi:MAG: excinuclease ABC subunit UvrC [Eubacteriales bacterium]
MEQLRDKAHSLPRLPGVYLMLDSKEKVIYVGKAKSLRNRVSQYFQTKGQDEVKTRALVSQIADFQVIVLGTEFEALVLESSLIKRHQPKYNILLKDSKGYPYIRLSIGEAYPKFSLVSHIGKETAAQAKYFGPYGSRHNTQAIIHALQTALGLPSCSRKFPRDIGKERPCLNHHMGKCSGHCRHQTGIALHQEAITQAVSLLEGKEKELEKRLSTQMEEAAEALRFEEAAALRDRLQSIKLLSTRQKVVASCLSDTDVIGFASAINKSAFVVLHYYQGELLEKDLEIISTPLEEEEESIPALLREYYGVRSEMPKEILLPCDIAYEDSLERMFSQQVGHKITFLTPQRGAKVEILQLAQKNAKEELERITTKEEKEQKNLSLLGKILGLPSPPRRIESYDISNQGDADIVASMVVYQDGKKKPSAYRKFKLQNMSGPDDYAAMSQVLQRRFHRLEEGDTAFAEPPDLLLMDGGIGHLHIAQEVLKEKKLNIPVFGMVKDNRHRTRALVCHSGDEIGLTQHPSIFALIGQIQEETHRVAITFHRQQRSKSVQGSLLDNITGVGKSRRALLLKEFGSVKKIRSATVEQLEAHVPQKVAKEIYEYFQKENHSSEKDLNERSSNGE